MASIVPVSTRLTSEVILNTTWQMLGYVHVLHGELHALRERVETLEATLKLDSTNSKSAALQRQPVHQGKEVKPKRAKAKKKRSKRSQGQVFAPWIQAISGSYPLRGYSPLILLGAFNI